jgi:predicted Holliday junction resolvase-like endonuclease
MTNNQLINFLQLQRQIFGVCPHTGNVFRLSECNIFTKKKPKPDWLEEIENAQVRINRASEKLDDREEEIRNMAREAGRKEADKLVRKIDKIFAPLKLNPDDSKVIFHPVDFIVFNGMKSGSTKNLILMDKNKGNSDERLQKSIQNVIEKEHYEWITLRVEDNGNIKQE